MSEETPQEPLASDEQPEEATEAKKPTPEEAMLNLLTSKDDDAPAEAPEEQPILEPVNTPAPKAAPAEAAEEPEEDEDFQDDIPEELRLRELPDDGINRRWYALHVHSGQEGNAREMLLAGAEQLEQADMITNVLVPMENVAEIRSGEKKLSKRKFFPGYVLIQLPEHPERYAELWQLIKETPGVTGFIGSRTAAVPLEDREVDAIVEVARGERERPKPKVQFTKAQRVKIIDGPFANFLGTVDEVNGEAGTLKVMVEIFERLTSIEVEFWQVESI